MTVRARFAPSPTGHLHVGGARTALYNWLFARGHGGRFILRIEDTDRERSTEAAIEAIIQSMHWLGLDWDGPVGRQTDNLKRYSSLAARLIEEGRAYYCYCSLEELSERRQTAKAQGRSPGYDRRCRNLSEEQKASRRAGNNNPSIRFKTETEGETVVNDEIRGRVVFNNADLDDLIIVRPDGIPTYNFASVIDDIDMEITHVIRGEDHLSNTPRQMQIYQALGADPPIFAHLSMILGSDKTPLSKRHGASSVEAFRDDGYLPEAIINFLALLGWSWDDRTTIFSREELIDKFSLGQVTKSPAVFDTDKLDWMNGQYIRNLNDNELAEMLTPVWQKAGLLPAGKPDPKTFNKLEMISSVCRERLVKLTEVIELSDFFFRPVSYDPKAVNKALVKEGAGRILSDAAGRLSSLETWRAEEIESELRLFADDIGEKPRKAFQPVRVAISGRLVSPPLFESLEILGKQETLSRIKEAGKLAGN